MEFHEKLQELRKSRNLTQEELAEALFVSRTAISKWESGRGYPSIDSLKEISAFFSVTIDELLSSEKLISIAEREAKASLRNICRQLFGFTDLLSILLILLPLYPETVDGFVYSVTLLSFARIPGHHTAPYWGLFLTMIILGTVQLVLLKWKPENTHKPVTGLSMGIHMLTVLYLALSRQAYACSLAFLLLIVKTFLLFRHRTAL